MRGFLPVRAERKPVVNEPNPGIVTSSPSTSLLVISVKNSSTIRDYLQCEEGCMVEETSLYEGSLVGIRNFYPDIVIFDCITWKGEVSDVDIIKEVRKIAAGIPILLATSSEIGRAHV